MSQISHIGADPGISNDQVGLRELLNSIDSRKYVLVTGPGMVMPPRVEDGRGSQESSSYLKRLLKGIVEWCIQNEIFTKKDVIGEIRQLLQKEALIHVGYKIEKYLVERSDLQRCLAGLLLYDAPIEELHRFVACLP